MKKEGFTLVELLAVIAILAIMVILAMPNIMKLFFSAKEDTFETEMKVIFDTAKTTYIKDSMFTSEKQLYCNTNDCEGKELDLNMDESIKYSIKLNKRGEVMCFQATNGTFYYVSQGAVEEFGFQGNMKYTDDSTIDFEPNCYYSVDYKNIKRINVLNIYPDNTTSGSYKVTTRDGNFEGCNKYNKYMSSSMKNWMEEPSEESENGYGKGIIKVIPVSFTEFNSNPNPNYWVKEYYDNGCINDNTEQNEILNNKSADLIFIGTWDANANTAYSDGAIEAIENWTKSGKPIIAGHDVLITQQTNSKKITEKLISYFGMKIEGSNSSQYDKVHILSNKKRNVFTLWPWVIISGDGGLQIPKTHTTQHRVTDGEVWITLGPTKLTEEQAKSQNKFYLATYNNTAMIQTGHSNAQATPDEQKIIANTIFFMYYKHVLKENGDEL